MSDPNEVDWRSIAIQSAAHDCLRHLRYVAHLGAPGKGQSWDCEVCGEHFHRMNADAPAYRYEDLDLSDFELQPWEVI